MPGGSRETFLVVHKNEAGRRGVAPAPEHEIEVGGRGSPGEGRDEECGVACGDEASRKLLRLGFAVGHHFIAPGDGGEISRTHAKPGERPWVAGVEDGANVGVVGDERGRLKRADLIRFTQGGHWRQRRVERGRSLWIKRPPCNWAPRPPRRSIPVCPEKPGKGSERYQA